MAGAEGLITPIISVYVAWMHVATITLALSVPFIRMIVKKCSAMPYGANEALHDGISAAALPSLLAMVLGLLSSEIITHINTFEFFAAGLLGIFQTVAQLFSHNAHDHVVARIKGELAR